jgi:hypothetical protein
MAEEEEDDDEVEEDCVDLGPRRGRDTDKKLSSDEACGRFEFIGVEAERVKALRRRPTPAAASPPADTSIGGPSVAGKVALVARLMLAKALGGRRGCKSTPAGSRTSSSLSLL